MSSILIIVVTFILYILAYHIYGKFLRNKIFKVDINAKTPSHTMRDDIDYIPTKKQILFGHHYTSIAGTGPIVGPAIGVIWGWVPALIWVVFGSILIGAVHDFGVLFLSMRREGRTIGDITGDIIHPRMRILFLSIIFFMLLLVIAVFLLVIATIFAMFPESVIPVWLQIPIAVWLGYRVRKSGGNIYLLGLVSAGLMYVTIIIGSYLPITLPLFLGIQPLTTWCIVLLIYAYVASVIPVWKLLQPRDFINSYQLFIALGLLVIGVFVARPDIVAPAFQSSPVGAPAIFPFLFVTIACGAISGFHSLVSSGTSSKQIDNEGDALLVGYGSMLLEGVLAVLVIITVCGGLGIALSTKGGEILTGTSAWNYYYSSWTAVKGLGAKIGAFIKGSGNLLKSFGIPTHIGVTIMGVFVASFAGTTLDTATRIQRYVITELSRTFHIRKLESRHPATLFAVLTAAALALSQGGGKGGLLLWPLFGTVNQLLAVLTFLTLSFYLIKKKINPLYTVIPMIIMFIITGAAMAINLRGFIASSQWHLAGIGTVILILELWMIAEALLQWAKTKHKTT